VQEICDISDISERKYFLLFEKRHKTKPIIMAEATMMGFV
jgi:hypothetical protein